MQIFVNGAPKSVPEETTVAAALAALGYEHDFYAVAINQECLRRKDYQNHVLRDQDQLEVLSPMAGG